jgi:uncharacterized protein (TIGR02231 family)
MIVRRAWLLLTPNTQYTMKKIWFTLCALALVLSAFAQDYKTVRPAIKEVTVFLSGAQITHVGDVQLKAGENKIRIAGLPVYLDPNSVQVEGNPDYTILSVRHQVNYLLEENSSPEVKQITDSIELINERIEEARVMMDVYNDEFAMLKSNQIIKGQDDPLLTEDLQEMANFVRNRSKEIRFKLLELQKSNEKNQAVIDRLNNRLSSMNASLQNNPGEVLVTINVDREKRSSLRLSYVAQAAGWVPVYDLRADEINSPIDFVYRAKVFQSTGMDWNDVMLTISTGNPTVGGQVPILSPWYVNIYEPYAPRGRADMYMKAPAEAPAAYNSFEPTQSLSNSGMTSASFITAVSNGVNVEFSISVPYDIPSDNQQYDVIMQKQKLKGSYAYVAVPKLDKDAFLQVKIADWMQYSLLAGESNIYFKGTSVGKGYIDPAMATDTLSISLGRDKSINVKREQIKEFCKTNVFGSTQSTSKAFEITVTNTKKQAIEMVLEDQLPISQNEELEVDTEELSGGSYDETTGKVTWNIKLEPGQTMKKQLKFTVKYPKKKYVSGL